MLYCNWREHTVTDRDALANYPIPTPVCVPVTQAGLGTKDRLLVTLYSNKRTCSHSYGKITEQNRASAGAE